TIQLTTANNEGLASTTQTRNFTVAYTPPATPTIVATPMVSAGYIRVSITNPTPGGGQPTVAGNDVWRRVAGTTAVIRLAANVVNNGTVNDWKSISGVTYE